MKKITSPEERAAILQEAREKGAILTAKKHGINVKNVYNWLATEKRRAAATTKRKYVRRATQKPEVHTIQASAQPVESKCAVIICNTSSLANVLKELANG